MRRILSFASILPLVSWLAFSLTLLAQDLAYIPTWNVNDTWTYTESGTYRLVDPPATITLNETLTYRVTQASDTEYTVAKTSSSVSGRITYSVLSFNLCQASDTGTLRVRRSDLRVTSEQRIIRVGIVPLVGCISNAVVANITLTNLGIGPSLYDFPLYLGSTFMFTPGLRVNGTITVRITGIPPVDQVIDTAPDTTVASTILYDETAGRYSVRATLLTAGAGGDVPTLTDTYDADLKTYRRQVLAANIPGLANANYTRNYSSSSLGQPSTTLTLNIFGPSGDASAQRGQAVILYGTVTPAPPEGTTVRLIQPEFEAAWEAATDADGNYAVEVTVPDNFMDTVMRDSGVIANAGIIANVETAYTVATLTVYP